MPACIKGSLPLGYMIPPGILKQLEQLDLSRQLIAIARAKLDVILEHKAKLIAMAGQLQAINVDVSSLQEKIEALNGQIDNAGQELAAIQLSQIEETQKNQLAIARKLESLRQIIAVDWSQSTLDTPPTGSESVTLDLAFVPYAKDNATQQWATVDQTMRRMAVYEHTSDVLAQLNSQIEVQQKTEGFIGFFMLSASCTHAYHRKISRLALIPGMAVASWNELAEDSQQRIDTTDIAALVKTAAADGKMGIVNEVCTASAFLGVLYVFDKSEQKSIEQLGQSQQMTEQLLQLGGWLNFNMGKAGIDDAIAEVVKTQLGLNKIACQLSFFSIGATTHATSSLVKDTAPSLNGQQQNTAPVLRNLSEIEQQRNNAIDINTLFQAYENYLNEIRKPSVFTGVPIGYAYKYLYRTEIVQLWLNESSAAIEPDINESIPMDVIELPDGVIGFKCTPYPTWNAEAFDDQITPDSPAWKKDWAGLYVAVTEDTALGYAPDYLDDSGNGTVYIQQVSIVHPDIPNVQIIDLQDDKLKKGIPQNDQESYMASLKGAIKQAGINIDTNSPLMAELGRLNMLLRCYNNEDGDKEIIVPTLLTPHISMTALRTITYKKGEQQ
jgi:hypothetical protein